MTDVSTSSAVSGDPLTVLVLAGGISHERDISLRSGRRVADALTGNGVAIIERDPDASLLDDLAANPPSVVWPALHGASGEDGALRGLLELLRIPFVGSSAASARLAWDKPTAKTLVSRANVATPLSVSLPRDAFRELGASAVLERIGPALPGPYVVKPARAGSSHGVTFLAEPEQLPRAMVGAYTYADSALIEQRVVGTEVSVGILDTGGRAEPLEPVEIAPRSGHYGYEERYTAGHTDFFVPARLDPAARAAVMAAAVTAHEALGLRHLSRVDFIVDAAGVPWFLEANVMPGLTETSVYPQALQATGHDLGLVYTALAQAAIDEAEAADPRP